jgi:SAM-dependent methyltransferase
MKDIFTDIIKNRRWEDVPCGSGSTLEYTKLLRDTLPNFLIKHNITSMLDAPCGDFSWMSLVNFPPGFRYIGGDIVNFMVKENQSKYSGRDFRVFDLTIDELPDVDMLFCRDCLFHLSEDDIKKVFDNVLASNVKYIMTTSYIESIGYSNQNIQTGAFRPINLERAPFNLPCPIDSLDDGPLEKIERRLCLWNVQDLQKAFK